MTSHNDSTLAATRRSGEVISVESMDLRGNEVRVEWVEPDWLSGATGLEPVALEQILHPPEPTPGYDRLYAAEYSSAYENEKDAYVVPMGGTPIGQNINRIWNHVLSGRDQLAIPILLGMPGSSFYLGPEYDEYLKENAPGAEWIAGAARGLGVSQERIAEVIDGLWRENFLIYRRPKPAKTRSASSPRKGKGGSVYFARQEGPGGLTKIGWTGGEPEKRIKALQTGSPHALHLVAALPGTMKDEAAIHAGLEEYRVGGEWFALGGAWEELRARQVDAGQVLGTARLLGFDAVVELLIGAQVAHGEASHC